MKRSTIPWTIGWVGVALFAPSAWAQGASPPQPSTASPAPITITGKLQRFTSGPQGEIDGLLLKDGRRIRIPPHLGAAVANMGLFNRDLEIRGVPGSDEHGSVVDAETVTASNANGSIALDLTTVPAPAENASPRGP